MTRRPNGRTGGTTALGVMLLVAAASVVACAPVEPSSPSPFASPVASAAESTPASSPVAASASAGAALDPGPSASRQTVVDETLLTMLPPLVDGAALTPDDATAAGIAAGIATDPGLADDLEALAVALYAGEADYAVVTLTRLREGVFGDGYFRDWRDSFDEAVCAQSGGVEGHAEATIGGRVTFIGTCAGGVRTYHTHLEGPDRIVSLQALGEARFGERILAGLTE